MKPDIIQILANELEHFNVEAALQRIAIWFHIQGSITIDRASVLDHVISEFIFTVRDRRSPTLLHHHHNVWLENVIQKSPLIPDKKSLHLKMSQCRWAVDVPCSPQHRVRHRAQVSAVRCRSRCSFRFWTDAYRPADFSPSDEVPMSWKRC